MVEKGPSTRPRWCAQHCMTRLQSPPQSRGEELGKNVLETAISDKKAVSAAAGIARLDVWSFHLWIERAAFLKVRGPRRRSNPKRIVKGGARLP